MPPAHLLLGFVTVRLLADRKVRQSAFRELSLGRPAFWLLLTTIYAAISAYFLPKLFAGQTFVFPVRDQLYAYAIPLAPATSNLTQSIYFVANFICFFVLCGYGGDAAGRKTLSDAALGCVLLNLVFAALDVVTYSTNTTEIMGLIRNANYALLSESAFGGLKRIVGSFVEASSFGYATLGYFAFASTLWLFQIRTKLTFILASLSLGSLFLSTSATAYVGVGGVLLLGLAALLLRSTMIPLTRQMGFLLFGAPLLVAIVAASLALNVEASSYLSNMADTFVLNKMSSSSGIERSTWNRQAIEVFFDTYGFGAGNGSLRASSFPLAVLGNLGIIGTFLFARFFIGLLRARSSASESGFDQANRVAAKWACLACLIGATVSGALTDLGLSFFTFAAIACSRPGYAHPSPFARFEYDGSDKLI